MEALAGPMSVRLDEYLGAAEKNQLRGVSVEHVGTGLALAGLEEMGMEHRMEHENGVR